MMKLPDSNSKFGAYSTNGELLNGNLSGLEEAARLLDSKRVALYVDSTPTGVILGTRLKVRILGGREERAIFFSHYTRGEFRPDLSFIRKFFLDAKRELNNLPRVKYEILGIWDKDDFEITETRPQFSSLSTIMGKIILGFPVLIKSTDLSLSFSIILDILQPLQMLDQFPIKIILSNYPADADVNISPMITNPDIEVTAKGEIKVDKQRAVLAGLFDEIYRLFLHYIKVDPQAFFDRSKEEIAKYLKLKLINESPIIQDLVVRNPKDLFSLYSDDASSLFNIVKLCKPDFISSLPLSENQSLKIIELIASSGLEQNRQYLRPLYHNIQASSIKNQVLKLVLSNGIAEPIIVDDAIERSIQNSDGSIVTLLLNTTLFEPGSNRVNQIIIQKHYDESVLLQYVDLLLSKQVDKGSDIGGSYVNQVKNAYQSLKYDIRKLNKVLSRHNRPTIPVPARISKNKRSPFVLIIILVIVVVVVVGFAFVFLDPLHLKPNASFSVNSNYGNNPFAVQFKDTTSPTPAKWHWTFGDGNFSEEQNPIHTYNNAGLFNVSLTVSTYMVLSNSVMVDINVVKPDTNTDQKKESPAQTIQ